MFSCVNIKDQAAAVVPNQITTNSLSRSKQAYHDSPSYANLTPSELEFAEEDFQNYDEDPDERSGGLNLTEREMLDRVLEEGMRLKLKCKQLRFSLLQQDQLLLEERQNFARKVDDMQIAMETTIAELRAKHYLEVTHVRDHRINEFQELEAKLHLIEEENVRYQILTNDHEEQLHQLQRKNYDLESELERERQAIINDMRYAAGYKDGLQCQSNEVEVLRQEVDIEREKYNNLIQFIEEKKNEEKKSIEFEPITQYDSNKKIAQSNIQLPLKNELVIQNDVHFYHCCHICAKFQEQLSQCIHDISELQIVCNQKEDEKNYYYEEMCRLEKQIHLLKIEVKDLENRGLSPQFHLQHTSDREKRLLQELQTSKDRIMELNQALEAILLTKVDVEDAAHCVTRDNQRLLFELYDARKHHQQQQQTSESNTSDHINGKSGNVNDVGKSMDYYAANRDILDSTQNIAIFRDFQRMQSQHQEQHHAPMDHQQLDAVGERCMLAKENAHPSQLTHKSTPTDSNAPVTSDMHVDIGEQSLSIDITLPSPPSSAADTPKKHYHHQLPIAVPCARRKQHGALYPVHNTSVFLSTSNEFAAMSSPPSINKRGAIQAISSRNGHTIDGSIYNSSSKVSNSVSLSTEFSPSSFHCPNPKPVPHHRRSTSETGTTMTTVENKHKLYSKIVRK